MNHFMDNDGSNYISHYGKGHLDGGHSGRYPWGSGADPEQRGRDIIDRARELNRAGVTAESQVAKALGVVDPWTGEPSTKRLRAYIAVAKHERRNAQVEKAVELQKQGLSLRQIAKEMGFKNDSSVRSLLDEKAHQNFNKSIETAEFIEQKIKENPGKMLDVGKGVSHQLGISNEKLDEALFILEAQGYPIYTSSVRQINNIDKKTDVRVICPPGTEYKEAYDYKRISPLLSDYTSPDNGKTFVQKYVYPTAMDSRRLKILYAEDGGALEDGTFELRPGVKDLALPEGKRYCQGRVAVMDVSDPTDKGNYYCKGMFYYGNPKNFPPGVDIIFHSNKPKEGGWKNALKKTSKNLAKDPTNPFGALIKKQLWYDGEDGKKHLGLLNVTREEGDWGEWSKKVPTQFLAKQPVELIRTQLNLSMAQDKANFDEIMSLTEPTLRRKFLLDYAAECDYNSVHMQAAAFPRQAYQVLLPASHLRDNECYAPQYKTGEKITLTRFPYAGPFEGVEVTVNNNDPECKLRYGNALDAVAVNHNNAMKMSGADNDGDTVMVIPSKGNGRNNKVSIYTEKGLPGLATFDTGVYGGKEPGTFKVMKNTNTEMGIISNLIMDMYLGGATRDELARAGRHSMVVIDAEKHELDYIQSYKDNGIAELKKKYQGHYDLQGKWHDGGASTLLTRAKNEQDVVKRKGDPKIDPETGNLVYKEVIETYTDKKGNTKIRTQKTNQMSEVDDARKLSSGTEKEELYANYANYYKNQARKARLEYLNSSDGKLDAAAKQKYSKEVEELNTMYNSIKANAPLERASQTIANATVKNAIDTAKANGTKLNAKDISKIGQTALKDARLQLGSHRYEVKFTDGQWEAIMAGAYPASKLKTLFMKADSDELRQRAMPKQEKQTKLTKAQINMIKAYYRSGYAYADIAEKLGVSKSTIREYVTE